MNFLLNDKSTLRYMNDKLGAINNHIPLCNISKDILGLIFNKVVEDQEMSGIGRVRSTCILLYINSSEFLLKKMIDWVPQSDCASFENVYFKNAPDWLKLHTPRLISANYSFFPIVTSASPNINCLFKYLTIKIQNGDLCSINIAFNIIDRLIDKDLLKGISSTELNPIVDQIVNYLKIYKNWTTKKTKNRYWMLEIKNTDWKALYILNDLIDQDLVKEPQKSQILQNPKYEYRKYCLWLSKYLNIYYEATMNPFARSYGDTHITWDTYQKILAIKYAALYIISVLSLLWIIYL